MYEADRAQILWDDGEHTVVWLGAGNPAAEKDVPSSQYLIVDNGDGLVLDPGGYHVFARTAENVFKWCEPDRVKALFFSHQDPDVTASLVSWLEVAPDATVYISRLWDRFIPHLPLPLEPKTVTLPDEGSAHTFKSGASLRFVPAHFLHSPGNFAAYDERSRTLFSGDVGSAMLAPEKRSLFVEDFQTHATCMEPLHRRYCASTRAIAAFLRRVQVLDVDRICPQHGPIFRKDLVEPFFQWLASIDKTGMDILFADL